jgi:hypothetical protein
MDAVVISAIGRRDWDWPCLHLEGSDTVDLSIGWLESAGVEFTLPTDVDITITLQYGPAEAASSANMLSETGAVVGNRVVISEFNPGELGGVYKGVARFTDANGVTRRSLNCIMSVAPNVFDDIREAVTLADVRMKLYDRLSTENVVIPEGQEFPDRLLFEGVKAAVRQWNDADGSPNSHTPQNFADRNMLIVGAAGWSLKSYQTLLARLQTPGQGQVSPETPRLQAYAAMGQELWQQYCIWMAERMRYEDANEGFYYA